jgi:glycerate-2-kinase
MDLKTIARQAARAALDSVQPERLVAENIVREGSRLIINGEIFELGATSTIRLISCGKAGFPLAASLLPLIEDKLAAGVVTGVKEYEEKNRIVYFPAAHPLPDRWSVRAGQKALELALVTSHRDLLLLLISGGGSAHLCLPADGLSLEDKRTVTQLLLKAGADIHQLNTVRKHISKIKGGRLLEAAWPGKVLNIIISDVIDNKISDIASGPAWYDPSTYAEALEVLDITGLLPIVPVSVKNALEEGMAGWREETIKEDNRILENSRAFIIGDNLKALYAAKAEVRASGLQTVILTSSETGEARQVASSYIQKIRELSRKVKETGRAFCFLTGGELTVTVKGSGRGGRNTEFALACLLEMEKIRDELAGCDWLIVSLASDGRDGPTDSAGAWITGESSQLAAKAGLNPQKFLDNNDSYGFFEKIGGLIFTGQTGTNVMDLRFFFIAPTEKQAGDPG